MKVRRAQEGASKSPASRRRLSLEERTVFMFGAVTLEILLERLRPTIASLSNAGVTKPQELAHWLNAQGHRTARGDTWTADLVAVLVELLRDRSGRRDVWNEMTGDLSPDGGQNRSSASRATKEARTAAPRGLEALSALRHADERGGPERWPKKLPRRGKKGKKRRTAPTGTSSAQIPIAQEIKKPAWKYTETNFREHSVSDLRDRWLNCSRKLSQPSDRFPKEEVKKLREAIEKEWRRRTGPGSNPDDYFRWPSTEAPSGTGSLSDPDQWLREGLLKFLQYSVGRHQEGNETSRRALLSAIFDGDLPPFHSADYMRGWGKPSTALRLHKMADSLAAFARNFKRQRDPRFDEAIADWESDLKYLYDTYYVGHFGFAWSSS